MENITSANVTVFCEPSTFYTQIAVCSLGTLAVVIFLVYLVRLIWKFWRTPVDLLKTCKSDFLQLVLHSFIYNFVFNKFYGFFLLCFISFLCLEQHCDTEREFYLKNFMGILTVLTFVCAAVHTLITACCTEAVRDFYENYGSKTEHNVEEAERKNSKETLVTENTTVSVTVE